MFIRCTNEDIYWCLIHEGFAVGYAKENIYEVENGLKELQPDSLEKYKNVFEFEVIDYTGEVKEPPRTWKQFNPKYLCGMMAQNKYNKYFKE
jgi:hypothetical protein